MSKAEAKKICIVVSSLGGGGAERSSALLSEILFHLGYDVHIVSVLDKIDYPFKGQLLNLGALKSKDDSRLGRLKRLKVFKRYLQTHNFDYIIDNRTRIGWFKEFVISKWVYTSQKTIYCVRSYNTDMYINPSRFLGKWLYNSAFKIVTVSEAISEKLKLEYGFENLEVIHNPIVDEVEILGSKSEITESFIIFYGRLEDKVKNISLLLNAYSRSELPKANMKLKILGKGNDKALLIQKSEELQINDHVEFLGFSPDPFSLVQAAYFTVLTSHYEGFPRVLVESLALGTPVVSVDCKSGPSEIVIHEHNGLLVENHNEEVLVNAMNRMLKDKDLYLHCKSNAKTSVAKFSKEAIGSQWQTLLK
ncbi:glycosyltransferase [Winogradskyella tangerina]|uniref:glycosyltransferase n=1 Tax=Winogradskyella tangerina TaxID=2023240 RepID=UPI000DBE7204|nr:glycosyltransferase [Winogradskyella tangerina]